MNQVNTNIFVNCGPNSITTPAGDFVPPYSDPLDPASVPSIVPQGAGVGKVTF